LLTYVDLDLIALKLKISTTVILFPETFTQILVTFSMLFVYMLGASVRLTDILCGMMHNAAYMSAT